MNECDYFECDSGKSRNSNQKIRVIDCTAISQIMREHLFENIFYKEIMYMWSQKSCTF